MKLYQLHESRGGQTLAQLRKFLTPWVKAGDFEAFKQRAIDLARAAGLYPNTTLDDLASRVNDPATDVYYVLDDRTLEDSPGSKYHFSLRLPQ
jgi:hypothetical protein